MSDTFWLGLHHMQIAIPRNSEDECRTFYTEVLGLTEVPKPPVLAAKGGLWYRVGNLELHLGSDDDFRPAKRSNPSITVANLDVIAEKLTQAGVEFTWDTNYPGHRRIHTFDNFGNRLEFFEA
ncbi:MAG: glyoxalase [Alicyclobacillus sp.]|nr:glyoxalase [Alicyclobacillus sp.]